MSSLRSYVTLVCACLLLVLGLRVAHAQSGSGSGRGSAAPGFGALGNRLRSGQFPHPSSALSSSSGGIPAGPAKIRVTADDGEAGPVVLVPKNGGFAGEFVVWNDGPGTLTVSRVAMRGDADDPRLPPRFSARFAEGGGASGVVAPHSSKRIAVTWVPDHDTKLRQALGHVVLTSNDEVAGEVAMGFVAPYSGPWSFVTAHLLSWLLLLPFLGAAIVVVLRIVSATHEEKARAVVLVLTAAQCLLATVLYLGWSGAVTRVDGNDGFQLVERVVLSRSPGVEYFVGIDGTSVSLVVLTALLGFVGAIASYGVAGAGRGGGSSSGGRNLTAYYALYALLLGGVMGVFVSLDLSLFVAFWMVMLGAVVVIFADATARGMRSIVLTLAALSAGLLVFAAFALYQHSDATFLGDGTRVSHTFAVPELMRVAYNAKHLTLLGFSWVKVVWICLFLAFAWPVGIVALCVRGARLDRIPTPLLVLLAGVVTKAGVYGLLRLSMGILPDGSRWAATTLVTVGVLVIVLAAVGALRADRLATVVGYALLGPMGFCLVGLGSMTREGLAGCLVQMFSHGIVAAILVLVVAVVAPIPSAVDAAGESAPPSETRARRALVGFALLAAAGVPGLPAFWGESLAILGAFPAQRVLAGIAAVGAAGLGVACAGYLGTRPPPPGLPMTQRDLAALTPLLVLSLALGLDPAPFFTAIQGGVSDLNQLVNPVGPDEIALAELPPPP